MHVSFCPQWEVQGYRGTLAVLQLLLWRVLLRVLCAPSGCSGRAPQGVRDITGTALVKRKWRICQRIKGLLEGVKDQASFTIEIDLQHPALPLQQHSCAWLARLSSLELTTRGNCPHQGASNPLSARSFSFCSFFLFLSLSLSIIYIYIPYTSSEANFGL